MFRRTSPNTAGYYRSARSARPRQRSLSGLRLLVGLGVACFALFSYFVGNRQTNPTTGEKQSVGLTTQQEIALGLQSAPQMIQQHGGHSRNQAARLQVSEVGNRLVKNSIAANSPWQFEFHLLADPNTVNAFALPGGQIFITEALYRRLETEGQLAGVLGHEIGHVIERHSAQRVAKQQLTEGILGAVVAGSGSYDTARMGQVVGQFINMQYGRDDELESDIWGINMMCNSGYDPHSLKGVMKILGDASGGNAPPEFMSTHPNPNNRINKIDQTIKGNYDDETIECMPNIP